MTKKKRPRLGGLLIEAAVIVVLAVFLGLFVGLMLVGFVNPAAAGWSWWPWYLTSALVAWVAARVFLPEAWHHRRSDKGGLAFVVAMLLLGLFMMGHMLIEPWP